jgi:hypothetical protein
MHPRADRVLLAGLYKPRLLSTKPRSSSLLEVFACWLLFINVHFLIGDQLYRDSGANVRVV